MPFKYENVESLNLINSEEFKSLVELYKSIPPTFAHQDYNLFHLQKKRVPPKNYKNAGLQKINEYGLQYGELHSHYFLKYTPGSFTKFHRDRVHTLSVVTFIEKSTNLVGGDTLFYEPYYETTPKENHYVKKIDDQKNDHQHIIPIVAPSRIGTSLAYQAETKHAVSRVDRGHRIVLVSWFKHQ